ncbi:MAG TPA: CPBP family intramembrane glutamic endopeptidase [Acidobacteriaceae bacterium]
MASGNITLLGTRSGESTSLIRHDLIELSIGYVLVLVVIWTPRPWQRLSYAFAATYLVATMWHSWPGWKAMGWQVANLPRSLWLIGVALFASAAAMMVANRMHTLHLPGGPLLFVERYAGYALGACVQQVLLLNFFLPRLLRLTPRPETAAVAAALMFSLAHLPNPILTVITFFWGLIACLFFQRYRNLYTLAIAHTILGITVAVIVPGPVIHNMRVGLGYLTYSTHHGHQRSH